MQGTSLLLCMVCIVIHTIIAIDCAMAAASARIYGAYGSMPRLKRRLDSSQASASFYHKQFLAYFFLS
jgi:hypothetical protein